MSPVRGEELGNDLVTWRAEIRSRIRRGETLDERELIQSLTWWLYGPRTEPPTGEWSKPTHRARELRSRAIAPGYSRPGDDR